MSFQVILSWWMWIRCYNTVLQGKAMLMKEAEVILLKAIVYKYLTGPQGLFIDLFAVSADWYRRLSIGRLEEIRDSA